MFDAEIKQTAVDALAAMCHHCGDNHTDQCPLAKAIAAVQLIPVQK